MLLLFDLELLKNHNKAPVAIISNIDGPKLGAGDMLGGRLI